MEGSRITDVQIRLFCEMMHKAFLEIRTLAGVGLSEQTAALADALHNLPLSLFDPEFSWERTRMHLESYQRRFPRRIKNDIVSGSYYDYMSMFDDIEKLKEVNG